MKITDATFDGMKRTVDGIKGISRTYALLRKISSINGANISGEFLDRVMYRFETLPPGGKEFWWFLFFGQDRRQMMLLVYRKFGRSMVFNGEEIVLKKMGQRAFRAVTAGWIYDGKGMRDLGVTNPTVVTRPREKMIASKISDRKMILEGSFPEYELKIDGLVHLKLTEGDFLENRGAHGVFIPPFGTGWVDVYSKAEGKVLGERFEGTAHLQKVVGVMPYGSFHWARVVFQNGSMISFFCLKGGKDSKRYSYRSMDFYDRETKRYIRFKKPRLMISKGRGETPVWTVEGWDEDNELRTVLEAYSGKRFTMKGGGSQVYIEYAVTPREFSFRTKDRTITLEDLGEGIGTFEDAYGSSFS
jgi:hypothetical protein